MREKVEAFADVSEANAERERGVPGAPDFGAMGCERAAEILSAAEGSRRSHHA
jgi:hypothetical protein